MSIGNFDWCMVCYEQHFSLLALQDFVWASVPTPVRGERFDIHLYTYSLYKMPISLKKYIIGRI